MNELLKQYNEAVANGVGEEFLKSLNDAQVRSLLLSKLGEVKSSIEEAQAIFFPGDAKDAKA